MLLLAKCALLLALLAVSRDPVYALEWRRRHTGHLRTLLACESNPGEDVFRRWTVWARTSNVHALHLFSELVHAALGRWSWMIGVIERNRRDGWGRWMTGIG